MIIRGHLGRTPERKTSPASQKDYFTLRVAENYGPAGNRSSLWFDVIASISPLDADLLSPKSAVQIEGRLDPSAYVSKKALAGEPVPTTWEGVINTLTRKKALCVGLKILTQKVEPYEFKRRDAANEPSSEESSLPATGTDAPPF